MQNAYTSMTYEIVAKCKLHILLKKEEENKELNILLFRKRAYAMETSFLWKLWKLQSKSTGF
jgi:hypothetical protein